MADRISQVPVEVVAKNVPVPPPRVTWRVGTINVPSGAGSGSVTGLGGQPKAVICYGTNWTTYDSVVTTAHLGLFRGMAGPKYDDDSLIQNAAFITPPGDAHAIANYAILALDTTGIGTNTLYRGTIDSLDSDGFSYSFDIGAAGGYQIVYLALMDDDTGVAVDSYIGALSTTLLFGYQAGASLYHGAWSGPVASGDDRTQEWFGGGAYRTTNHGNWTAAWLSALCFPTSSSGQTYNEINANFDPTTSSATGGHFIGPFLVAENLKLHPAGTYFDQYLFSGVDQGGMVIAWSDPDSGTGFKTPAASTGGTATVSGIPFEPGLLLGYTLSGLPSGSGGTGGAGAAGFYVVTPDFQWCATCGGSGGGSFQSFQRGFCDRVTSGGAHAGTVQLTADGFVMTTEEDDVSQADTSWQLFGHPQIPRGWWPQIVRYL